MAEVLSVFQFWCFFSLFFSIFNIHTLSSFPLLVSCALLAEARSGLWASQQQLPITCGRCTAGFTHCKTPLCSSPDVLGFCVFTTVLPWGCGRHSCRAAWAVSFRAGFCNALLLPRGEQQDAREAIFLCRKVCASLSLLKSTWLPFCWEFLPKCYAIRSRK